jgi:hypothetical protein
MATVTPGKIFTSNEIVTPANINLLGTPTVALADGEVTTSKILDANVTTAKIAANAVTAAKLGANEQRQICKAWVNFTGLFNFTNVSGNSGTSFVTTNGSANAVWNNISTLSEIVGAILYLPTINGVAGATLGGVNVATEGFQITGVNSASQYAIKLLAGPATSSQTVNGNGTASGYTRSTSGIRASYNVSSITRNGTGNYSINFTTPMADANYCVSATHMGASGSSYSSVPAVTLSQSSVQLVCTSVSGASIGAAIDSNIVFCQIFGN